MHGLTHSMLDLLPIHGFSIGEKKFKQNFQTSFRNGGSILELFKIFYVLKLENLLIISKQVVKAFSLWEIVIHYLSVLNLESLGLVVGNLPPIASCLLHFPNIWLGNLKSNGGQPLKLLQSKPLNPSKIGLIPKNPNPKSPQSQRFQFGPNLCQAQFLGPKLHPKIIFLQILIQGLSKKSPRANCRNYVPTCIFR